MVVLRCVLGFLGVVVLAFFYVWAVKAVLDWLRKD